MGVGYLWLYLASKLREVKVEQLRSVEVHLEFHDVLCTCCISHRIHGAGMYANIWGILMVNVTMDPMGLVDSNPTFFREKCVNIHFTVHLLLGTG